MKIKRVFDVLFKEDLHTFKYLVSDNLNEKKNDEIKYKNYIRKYENVKNMEKTDCGKEPFSLGIIIWCGESEKQEETVKSIISGGNNILTYCMQEGDSLSDGKAALKCDYVGFMSPGDILDKNAYAIISKSLSKNRDCICFYTDEDMMNDDKRYNPLFKPDFSFDTLMSFNYIGGFFAVRDDFLASVSNDINQTGIVAEYMILLSAAFNCNRKNIMHISSVLLHKKKKQNYSQEMLSTIASFKKAFLSDRMTQGNMLAEPVIEVNEELPVYYIYTKFDIRPKISIIIPSKDNPALMKTCLESLHAHTVYSDYEVVVVDNGSSEKNQKEYKKLFSEIPITVKYIYEPMDFNFSKMCNIGVKNSNGRLLLFLNDDIEILQADFQNKYNIDWLDVMAGDALDKHTGAVGVKLLYPNSTLIQHTGIVNYESGAAHIFSGKDDKEVFPEYRNKAVYNYLCVTGACLMVSREKFDLVGGFEEKLAVTFNDVELCFKLYEAGFDNLVRNDIVHYHHESITRGEDAVDDKKFQRHLNEREKLFDMHPDLIKYDPYYSRFLNQKRLDCSLSTEYYVNLPAQENDSSQCYETDVSIDKICGKIRSAVIRDNLEIQGFIYNDGNKSMKKCIPCIKISVDDRQYYFDAVKVYDPTMTKYIKSRNNLNFASFYCCIDYEKIGMQATSNYAITLCLRKGEKIYISNIEKSVG